MNAKLVYSTRIPNLEPSHSGKVRDIYDLGDRLLLVATDRLSAFDVVFPNPIPYKGRALTQMTLFWLAALADIVPNHLISADIEDILDAVRDAGGKPDAQAREELLYRSMLVKKAQPFSIECVVRGYMAGSLWKEYKELKHGGNLLGYDFPEGLELSSRLPQPIFTPATKAVTGHDENISRTQAAAIVGQENFQELERISIALYNKGRAIAAEKGLIIADTKFEFGQLDGQIILIDEVLTPDSSRFWDEDRYKPGVAQDSFDKQYVRDFLEGLEWDKTPPAPELPEAVVGGVSSRYLEAYRRISGRDLLQNAI